MSVKEMDVWHPWRLHRSDFTVSMLVVLDACEYQVAINICNAACITCWRGGGQRGWYIWSCVVFQWFENYSK